MTNPEILNRFDVLYNNITSSQAPGLDGHEKSVFWNKATLEVLKNKLNLKGNKYGEGIDGSSKRQVEFSTLVVRRTYNLYPQKSPGLFCDNGSSLNTVVIEKETETSDVAKKVSVEINTDNILSILNESLEVVSPSAASDYQVQIDLQAFGIAGVLDMNGDGVVNVSDVSELQDWFFSNHIFEGDEDTRRRAVATLANVLLTGVPATIVLTSPVSIDEIRSRSSVSGSRLTVVPINHVEYDTLMSRPYKYPPRSQAWRMFVDGKVDVIAGPNDVPIQYRIRYVKMPKYIDLTDSSDIPEVPEVLHDEILQRAVELAKAAYVGDMNQQQIIQGLGERSE